MSDKHVRISASTIETITRLSDGQESTREFIENLIRRYESGELTNVDEQHATPKDDAETGVFTPDQTDQKLDRIIALIKVLGMHCMDDQEGLHNALNLLSQKAGTCAQCNKRMVCENCGCYASDHLFPEE